MEVWVINLLDNRAEQNKPTDLQKTKFQFCKERGIVGIGWVGHDSAESKDIGFLRADNAIAAFKKDDLVWTKDPDSKEYYICRITSEPIAAQGAELHRYDISKFCHCEFTPVGTEENLPQGILKEDLISRTAISKANSTVSEITQAYMAALIPSLQSQTPSVSQPTEITPKAKKQKPSIKKIIRIAAIPVIILAVILVGIFAYKGITKSMYPLLPNRLDFGDSFKESSKEMQSTGEPNENKARKSKTVATKLSELGITNTDAFYSRLSVPLREKNPGTITYTFNTDTNALQSVQLDLMMPSQDSLPMDDLVKYYQTALKAYGDVSIERVSIENMPKGCTKAYHLTCEEYSIRLYACEQETDAQAKANQEKMEEFESEELKKAYKETRETYGPPFVSIVITNSKYAPKPHQISEQAVMDILNNAKYNVGNDDNSILATNFSIGLVELLNRCAPDYQVTVSPYLNTDSTLIPKAKSEALEKGEYAEYLSSSHIVQITGDLMRNPKLPYYVNEDVNIITLLLIFDESDQFIAMEILEEHRDLHTCAVICVTN